MVVPPRARSANPSVITARAATQSAIDLVRGFIPAAWEDAGTAPDSGITR